MPIAQTKSTQVDRPTVITPSTASAEPGGLASDAQISRLIGQVYECAPAAEQSLLLEHLLNPLGALARVTVVRGVFAECLFRSGWRESQVHLRDAPNVHMGDIIDLVDYVQKVSVESVNALGEMIKKWPVIGSSVTSGLLMTELMQREKLTRIRRKRDDWEP